MSPSERRALVTVLVLGVCGHLLRASEATPVGPSAVELFDSASYGDPLAQLELSRRLDAPLGGDERVDIDTAGFKQLQRLPGIGPALARRIVADRENRGAFGGISQLQRVSGIGPATLANLKPHLTFSGRSADDKEVAANTPVALNQAGVEDFKRLPGIGPVRAQAIVAFRDSAGPFRNIKGLSAVPGISPGLVDRLAPSIRL